MHVVVVGCGRVGSGLARELTAQGHSVAVIDRNEKSFRRLPEDFAGITVTGIGFDREVLAKAGIDRADALACVTNGDNSNIVIARVAKETYEIKHVVARIYDPRRAEIYQKLGIPTVATSSWTVAQVMRFVAPTEHSVQWSDPTAEISLLEHTVTAALAGTAFAELELADLARVIAVTRVGQTLLGTENLVCQEGDTIYLAAVNSRLDELDQRLAGRAHGHPHADRPHEGH